MCCGNYKNELFRQNTINKTLVSVHNRVMAKYRTCKKEKNPELNPKKEAEAELYRCLDEQEFIIKLRQSLILDVNYNKVTFANSLEDALGSNSHYKY